MRRWIVDKEESSCPLCCDVILAETVTLGEGGNVMGENHLSTSQIYRTATLAELLMGVSVD